MRKAHFPRLQLFLPFAHAAEGFAEARAALLRGAAPDGTCKEVVVLRDPPVVWVYNVVEHGRSTYREVVFCSRADCCLASLPSAPAEHSGVPVLACGEAMAPAVDDASLVITRQVPVTLAGLPPFLAPASAGTPRRTKSADRFEFGSVSSPHGCEQGSVSEVSRKCLGSVYRSLASLHGSLRSMGGLLGTATAHASSSPPRAPSRRPPIDTSLTLPRHFLVHSRPLPQASYRHFLDTS